MATSNGSISWSEQELRRKVGQLFITGFHSTVPDEHIKRLITDYHVGNVILFQRNVASKSQLLQLTSDLQQIAKDAGHSRPLFISIDQENGLVTRLKPEIAVQMPGAMTLAATRSEDLAEKVAAATGETLRRFGINMNYGPVADTNSEPRNPVIGVRSPSDDPELVGQFVIAQIRGIQSQHVVPCIKHFPGHGDTTVDSHYGLPVIGKSKSELEECELIPFRRAVAQGVECVMTAHISLPRAIGDQVPASLNQVATDILRQEMRYEGLIISDCLEMDGVRATFGTERAAVMALKAGTDCPMICHTLAAQVGAVESVISAVKSGELSRHIIQRSLDRLSQLKDKYLSWDKLVKMDQAIDHELCARHEALSKSSYSRSVTVVRAQTDLLPLAVDTKIIYMCPAKAPLPSGVIESGETKTRTSYAPDGFISILKTYSDNIKEIQFFEENEHQLKDPDWHEIKEADVVILATRNARLAPYQKDMGLRVASMEKKLIIIAICDPYDFLDDVDNVKTYLTIYEPTIEAFTAALDVIFGKAEATGVLPVKNVREKHAVEVFDLERDLASVHRLWNDLLPTWEVSQDRLRTLLRIDFAEAFVVQKSGNTVGFCLGYLNSGGLSKITCILVQPEHQGKGIGTALFKHIKRVLMQHPETKSLSLGSVFPRFWPGLPIDLHQKDLGFFRNRGFIQLNEKTPRDLYQDIRGYKPPATVMQRADENGITFAPLREELADECLEKQRKNFYRNQAWVTAYEKLIARGEYDSIMVAFDSTGAQVGWTLMCSPTSLVSRTFAFLPLVAESGKTGLIACVGVDEEARKGGIGIAMLCKAIENMAQRGLEYAFIDWVVIRGFYEKLGFEVWREYHAPYVW